MSGKVAITKQNEGETAGDKIVGYISVGEFIGESSFINKHRKSASAKAVEDSIILCIDQDALRDLPAKLKDKCKDAIIEGMAARIVYLTEQIQQLCEVGIERLEPAEEAHVERLAVGVGSGEEVALREPVVGERQR